MTKFLITYTDDFGKNYKTLPPIEAENKSKAYIEAYVAIPLRAAITDVQEVKV
jgi:hypothetical protein